MLTNYLIAYQHQTRDLIEFKGGGGLTASCADYLAFLNDLLSDSPKILKKSTVDAYISTNQLADHLSVQILAANYPFTDERGFIPSEKVGHSIACAVTMDEKPGMRPKGSWAWAGLLNSYFWADPKNKVAGG